MSLLKKGAKKPLKMRGGAGASGEVSSKRPVQEERQPPCMGDCASFNDVRGWITTIAQREKTGIDEAQAFADAWRILTNTNPFPAVMGRVCPHPCESACNRSTTDGSVAINAMERFIGDWALEHKVPFDRIEKDDKPESIGVIGAGPGGLSFAFQMARRGYPVTVYDRYAKPGGMLFYGIPRYRLPEDVMMAEIQRILDMGVKLELGTVVGKDVTIEELRKRHKALYLGIGAHQGKPLRIPGEEGTGFFTGTDYLNRVNRGETVDVGKGVAVIGGGDTAVDAARVARRTGAEVTIVYRRTRTEMPAIDSEVEDAFLEGIKIEFLLAPMEVKRENGKLKSLVVQRQELGEPDSSGRRRPVPITGSEYEIPIDTIISAVSQVPDWKPLEEIKPASGWLEPDGTGKVADDMWAGGDVLNLGIASTAIAHGRRAAEAIHAKLRGLELPAPHERHKIAAEHLHPEFYEAVGPRTDIARRPVEDWLQKPNDEINLGITKEQFLGEAKRCYSCGSCFGCERCWMYCTPACFTKVKEPKPGVYYTVRLDTCDGCGKCADACPCGFLAMR